MSVVMAVNRRAALTTGLGAYAAAATWSSVTFAQRGAMPPLRVVVTLNGQSFTYAEERGEDQGAFKSEIGGFSQRCIRCEAAGSPLVVYLRPDVDSPRVEVVFELGGVFSGAPAHLGAYTVVILRGDQELAAIKVPAHYWFARWRWQSQPRPVVGDVAQLIAQHLLPPFDLKAGGGGGKAASTVAYTPMGTAGITAYMPQTGERPDIGIVTEPQAEYICTRSAAALDRLRAQGEGAGTVPWHMRDENQGAPLDLRTHPEATWYPDTDRGKPYVKTLKSPITVDSAHQPALAYVPYILTGDPYHLEDLQFQANWNLGALVRAYRFTIPQTRAFAWSLRSLAQCAKVTPARVPRWLLPQGYWTSFLGEYRSFFEEKFVRSTSPEHRIFRATRNVNNSGDEGPTAPKGTWVDPWQDEFLSVVLGWIVTMGFKEWKPAFDWKIASTLARTSADQGWVRAHATPYRMILRPTAAAPFAKSWAEAWALQQTINKATYTDPDTWVNPDMTYLTYTRAALVYAAMLGAPGAGANLAWASRQLKAKRWPVPYRWQLTAPAR
jgi:hypothetical protein